MINSIEHSLQKFFKDNGISVSISQPDGGEWITCISLMSIDIDATSFNEGTTKEEYTFGLNVVADSHSALIKILELYIIMKKAKIVPMVIYDFETGTAIKNIDSYIEMPNKIAFNSPFTTKFIDELIVTIKRII